MFKTYNPASVGKPASTYSHAIEVPPNARLLFLAGQAGTAPDGTVREGAAAQTEQVWINIRNILAEAGMDIENLVKITTIITRTEDTEAVRAVRARMLGNARPAATFLVVKALARPDLLVEVEAVAAKV